MNTIESNVIYLVDLENTGTKLLFRHMEHHGDVEYVIFYSDNTLHPGSILEHIPDSIQVTFIYCRTGGNNAMDFCICAFAGKLANRKVRILSNDKGYDPMVHMLQEQGVRINRESINQPNTGDTEHAEQVKSDKSVQTENIALTTTIRRYVPKQYQDKMISLLQGAANRREAHEICQAVLPQKIVAETYKKVKKHIPKEVI